MDTNVTTNLPLTNIVPFKMIILTMTPLLIAENSGLFKFYTVLL